MRKSLINKIKTILPLLIFLGFTPVTFAKVGKRGTSDGGGGGDAHSRFIKTGLEIADYFQNADAGKKTAKEFKLDSKLFASVFSAENIRASAGPLQDRLGNVVDARVIEEGSVKFIEIDKNRFQDFFDRDIDVYHLVAKEAFRFLGYDETSLAMSLKLIPFRSGPVLCDPQLTSKLGKRSIEIAEHVASIAENGGSWKPWEKALCLNYGYLQESLFTSMGEVMKCVQNEPSLYKEAVRLSNVGSNIGKKCWDNMSRGEVKNYFSNLANDAKNLLTSAGL